MNSVIAESIYNVAISLIRRIREESKMNIEKRKAICQLNNLKNHCNEMSDRNYGKVWEKDAAALNFAIDLLKNDRNEMIVEDIKRIIERYDEMNLNVSFEERKENHIKAYMEIKDYFNTEDKKE